MKATEYTYIYCVSKKFTHVIFVTIQLEVLTDFNIIC